VILLNDFVQGSSDATTAPSAPSARARSTSSTSPPRGGKTLPASTYRRLQRFFQHVRHDPDWAVPMLAAMIGTQRGRAPLL
jgi:hypothetical protein